MLCGNKALIAQFVTVLLILSDAGASVVAAEKWTANG